MGTRKFLVSKIDITNWQQIGPLEHLSNRFEKLIVFQTERECSTPTFHPININVTVFPLAFSSYGQLS